MANADAKPSMLEIYSTTTMSVMPSIGFRVQAALSPELAQNS